VGETLCTLRNGRLRGPAASGSISDSLTAVVWRACCDRGERYGRPASQSRRLPAGPASSLLFIPPTMFRLPMISLLQPCSADSDQPTLHPCNLDLYSMHEDRNGSLCRQGAKECHKVCFNKITASHEHIGLLLPKSTENHRCFMPFLPAKVAFFCRR
jgi:hypothetical protein